MVPYPRTGPSWQAAYQIEDGDLLEHYCQEMLKAIGQCIIDDRPGRFEPRVVKLRRNQYKRMSQPRNDLRKRLEQNDNSFEQNDLTQANSAIRYIHLPSEPRRQRPSIRRLIRIVRTEDIGIGMLTVKTCSTPAFRSSESRCSRFGVDIMHNVDRLSRLRLLSRREKVSYQVAPITQTSPKPGRLG